MTLTPPPTSHLDDEKALAESIASNPDPALRKLTEMLAMCDDGLAGPVIASASEARQTSSNDDQEYREDDIFISECASAIASMLPDPWHVHHVDGEQTVLISWLAKQLGAISVNPVSSGHMNSVTGNGRTCYVQVGSNRIVVPDSDDGRNLNNQLRTKFRKILAPRRRALAKMMLAEPEVLLSPVPAELKYWSVQCGPVVLWLTSEKSAHRLADKLNEAYMTLTKPWSIMVMDRMTEALKRISESK